MENTKIAIEWPTHQRFEKEFWGDCRNTFAEEQKQVVYARHMGMGPIPGPRGEWPYYNVGRKQILDIGGGPCSLLLKSNACGAVIDPCDYPQWVADRYKHCRISYLKKNAEDDPDKSACGLFDEVWIYNTLQHVIDPEKIINNAFEYLDRNGVLRMFEWIYIPESIGHPHMLTDEKLIKWISAPGGSVRYVNESGAVGKAFFGVFRKSERKLS